MAQHPSQEFHPREHLLKVFRANPTAKGLALIATNQRGSQENQRPLLGVQHDYDTMMITFKKLKYGVFGMRNIPREVLMAVIHEACTADLVYPESYRRIVFIFSGHGLKNAICTHTGDILIKDIIEPFQPSSSPHLGSIPKLFFIDACRGVDTMVPVVLARGGKDETKIAAPRGNIIVAYSTWMSYKAYECSQTGGIWMNLLAQQLLESEKSILDVLIEVNRQLQQLQYSPLKDYIQVPYLEGHLNEAVHFLQESKEEPLSLGPCPNPLLSNGSTKAEGFPPILFPKPLQSPPGVNGLGQHQSSPARSYPLEGGCSPLSYTPHLHKSYSVDSGHPGSKAHNIVKQISEPPLPYGVHTALEQGMQGLQIANHRPSYDALLKQYMDEGWIKNYEYTCDASPNGTTYKAAVILTLEGNTTVECRGEGPDSTTAVERAGEEAVRVVWRRRNKISGNQNEQRMQVVALTHRDSLADCITPPSLTHRDSLADCITPPSLTHRDSLADCITPGLLRERGFTCGNSRQKFNEWCQRNGISADITCDVLSCIPLQYQCRVTYTVNRQTGTFLSGYHHSKRDAKEEATERALYHEQMKAACDLKSAGKPPKKILQEYCDQPQLCNPDYVTVEVQDQQFQSTVTVRGRLEPVQGDVFVPKAAAEHSAALRALYKLGEITL